jgi:type I restriction enzyme S subunit
MTAAEFLTNFGEVANAPGGVARLRELVLSLAVQGKLIPQHPDDEPTEICLTRLGLQATIKADENTEALPSSWMRVRFEDVALTAGGVTLGRNLVGRETVSLPYLRVANVKRGGIDTSVIKEVSIAKDEVERYALRENDLLMTEGGDWDKVGRAAIWKGQIPVCLHQNHVFRSRFRSNEILPVWFERYFNSPVGRSYFESASKQTTNLASINMRQVRGCPVPFPPLAEQKRIVAKVDELMALCDQLEAQQQERERRFPVLSRTCHARFAAAPTPANLNRIFDETGAVSAEDMRNTILALARLGRFTESTAECPTAPLGDVLAEPSSNGVSKGPTSDKTATEVLRISAGTSRSDFYVNEDDVKHVSLTQEEMESARLRAGDLLACRYNGNLHYVGRFSLYRGESGRVQVNPDKLIRFRVDLERLLPRYVCYMMNAAPTREIIESMCATTAGNIGLSAGRIKTVEIPIPPLAEQRRIVAKVDELMALVDQLEAQQQERDKLAEAFAKACVASFTHA